MSDNNLLVSIITPTFNRGETLEKTILSIKNQDYANIEHIVVDGLSTDNTMEILKKNEGSYNLRWISEKDSGCADAMEKGFQMAKGDIFCWLDSDDIYLPGTIKKVVDVFEKIKNVDVVFGDMFVCDSKDKIIDYIKRTKFDIDAMIYLGMIISPQATFWRKDLHKKINGIDRNYLRCADYDFFTRMGLANANFYHLRDYLAIYRVHPQQLTKSLELCRQEANQIFEKYKAKNLTGFSLKIKKTKTLFKRALFFILQGDVVYAARSFLTRLGLIRKSLSNENNTYQF